MLPVIIKNTPVLLLTNLPMQLYIVHLTHPPHLSLPQFFLPQGTDLWILSYSGSWIFGLSPLEKEEKETDGEREREEQWMIGRKGLGTSE